MPLLLALVGCLTAEPAAPPACNKCHGSEETPAPPNALGGFADPEYPGVGAHQAHLFAASSRPVACNECHHVPEGVDDEGHRDTPWPAEVTWDDGEIAQRGAEPFDHETQTCVVYCHGSTLVGGDGGDAWTDTIAGCTACHGFPPAIPAHDGVGGSCSGGGCHEQGADIHIDGRLDFQ